MHKAVWKRHLACCRITILMVAAYPLRGLSQLDQSLWTTGRAKAQHHITPQTDGRQRRFAAVQRMNLRREQAHFTYLFILFLVWKRHIRGKATLSNNSRANHTHWLRNSMQRGEMDDTASDTLLHCFLQLSIMFDLSSGWLQKAHFWRNAEIEWTQFTHAYS